MERFVLVHSEVRGTNVVAIVASQRDASETRVHVLTCALEQALIDDAQVELAKWSPVGQIPALRPAHHFESSSFAAPTLPQSQMHTSHVRAWAIESGIQIEELVRMGISLVEALPKPALSARLEISSVPLKESLSSGVLAAFGYSVFGGVLPSSPKARWSFVGVMEHLLAQLGVENNIKVYSMAFNFSRPKAHKDVRTYRQAIGEIERA